MESKKLQQMQQANTHLIPQPMPQIKAPLFHQVTGDYGPHSPVFQNVPQYNSVTSNFAQIERTGHHQPRHHSSQHHLAPSSNNHLHIKPLQNSHSSMLSSYTAHRQTQPTGQSLYGTDSVYQNNRDRHYQQSALRTQPTSQHNHSHPMNKFQSEYQQLQQAKIQQQIQTQNEALIQQQRTFAIRQQLNPPIPQSHMHNLQSSQNLRSIPPSTLNLTTQFQPASGPSDSNNDEKIYGAQRNYNQTSPNSVQSQSIYHQKQKSNQQLARQKMQESSPSELTPIIQQNHPDLVVNQACQTQIPETIASKSKSQTESPVHQSLERKKSSGTIQSLKSPVTKRPASAPVTLSGWLYKQGSEGLKVWRKRWFVLSEYCLYYYKGPEEEKLLGSILLPSYRVAACLPEDKIYRKFAFKCEHQNMRTYWLSAETSEIMGHWIRALTAATVMQSSSESSDHVSQPSFSSLNPSGENSDSGILTYQSQQSKISALQSHGPVTPAMDTGGPLYANAPPKPRRANDGGYSSPSPENSIDRYEPSFDKNKYFDSTAQPQSYHPQHMLNSPISQTHLNEPIYGSQHLNKSNSMQNHKFKNNWETSNSNQIKSPYGQDMQQQDLQNLLSFSSELYQSNRDNIIRAPHRFEDYGRKHFNEQNDVDTYGMQPLLNSRQKYELQMEMNNSERRTPDTYGRSRIDQINRNLMDYEDIYNLNSQPDMNVYRRPTSPPSHKNLQTLQHLQGSSQRAVPSKLEQKQNVRMRRPVQSIPRPHSADFLEYETRMESANNPVPEMMRAPRPKSSLDINRTPDNFYYSEASYAEKMRQSALYLQKTPSGLYGKDKHSEVLKQSNSRGDISGHNMGYNTIPGESGFVMHSDSKHNNSHTPRNHRSYNKNVNLQNEQFLRSASVRLPRKADDTGMRDSEQKREESMKRLLEWKQRMLQSPLTRKGVPISLAMDAKTPLSVKTANITQGIQRSRSATNANNAGYNSYSSDDEDEPHIPPAGRASPRPTPPSSSSEETVPSQYDYPKPNPKALCTTLLDKDSYVPVYAQKTVKDSISTGSEPNSDQISIVDGDVNSSNSTDSTVNVKSENSFTEISVDDIEEVCNQDNDNDEEEPASDGVDDEEKSFEYTDGDLEEALESKSDDGDEAKTPTNDTNEEISESHYMPMTPKKSILSMSESNIFASSKLSMNDVDNDNAYVEMTTMGFNTSILANDSKSSYELVCINKKSNHCRTESEPVYMELSHLKNSTLSLNSEEPENNTKPSIKKSGNKKGFDKRIDIGKGDNLPDILKLTKNVTVSESSDTEDENPSDLYNVDLRSRTRFSLSDTFRPASYYLGVTRPDSSDSEIVSPPPIPSSPPPMEELNTEEIFSAENCDTIRRKGKNSLNLSYDQIPRLHSSNSSLNSIKKDGIKTSRLSLPEQYLKYKIKKTDDSSSNYNTDNSSPTSSDYDLYNKLKLQSPSFSGSLYPSNVSLRFDGMDNSSVDEQRMKRRPISEDSMSEIESDRFDQDIPDVDLNAYLNNLQSSNVYSDKQMETQWSQDSILNDVPFIKPPEVFRSENDKIFYDNINFLKNDECALNNEQRRKAADIENKFDLSSINDNPKTASTPKTFKSQHLNYSHPRTASMDSTTSHSSKRSYGSRSDNNASHSGFDISMLSPVHSRVSSNISELSAQSAPYYYKDVTPVENTLANKSRSNGSNLSLSYSSPKLNNMREVGLKRNGISHIHNQLDGSHGTIASATISEDILNVANKTQLIDSKNLYGKDVKMEKNVSKELTTGYVANKLYGRSEGVKTNKATVDSKVLNNITPPKTNNTTVQCNTDRNGANTYSNLSSESRLNRSNHVTTEGLNESSDGNSLWEEDEIWRERLRRVSHRHARSLDDLDKIDKDCPVGNGKNATEKPQIRANPGSTRNEPVAVAYDENDVYVQLAKDSNSDLYERLRDDNVRKSVEINRETLRQWDSMSSGLMKSATGSNIGVGLQSKTKTSNVDSEDSGSTSGNKLGRTHSKSYHIV
ncbi:uncharacterized protein LOC119068791 isoform X1 [Bradysia coprophila]|uniref:uncharacterized protein LOC119068791 isoform X1 n=1 Tax=Bradysia coprophila TaxID=38358 RepID=UPI00187D8CBC|nr:uncharacterized protein LOC119068791 isoform X1 [Bradysia coprophila]